jgi:hypothetical protein
MALPSSGWLEWALFIFIICPVLRELKRRKPDHPLVTHCAVVRLAIVVRVLFLYVFLGSGALVLWHSCSDSRAGAPCLFQLCMIPGASVDLTTCLESFEFPLQTLNAENCRLPTFKACSRNGLVASLLTWWSYHQIDRWTARIRHWVVDTNDVRRPLLCIRLLVRRALSNTHRPSNTKFGP